MFFFFNFSPIVKKAHAEKLSPYYLFCFPIIFLTTLSTLYINIYVPYEDYVNSKRQNS